MNEIVVKNINWDVLGHGNRQTECDHRGKTDLTKGKGETRNYYCPRCQCHWYLGKFWTKTQWDEYVEDFWKNFDAYVPSDPNQKPKVNPYH